MSSRFVFPHAYDPHMAKDEIVNLSRASTNTNTMQKPNGSSPPSINGSTSTKNVSPQSLKHRSLVFSDPVAFRLVIVPPKSSSGADISRYLEEDAATVVIERCGQLQGYEIYLVEQWACSRVHPTFVITTFTADPTHTIQVGVLGVPADEEAWSPRLRVYFKAISQYNARPKDTPLGVLMVTNLSTFPSSLTVIPVPDGDVRKHREDFIVNESLKRLGCSGRSGMSLSTPAGATQAKFLQLYKTSDRIPLYGAVIELVKLCQVALMLFGKLEQEYADGCLCDVTEKAVNDWWTEIGAEYYNIEPTDGILGPTTVAALLGLLMGARNRLNYFGAPVSKDAFDVPSLKRGIAYFQKSQKLEKTRRLDRHTLNRLHQVTAKAAAGEGWAVPKAVKSTVAELSGKGGEMVMGMVGRDKAGIGDIETVDIDRFVGLLHGARAKWLWYGKSRRAGTGENNGRSNPDAGHFTFTKDDQGGYLWSHSRADSLPLDDDPDIRKKDSNTIYSAPPPESATSMVTDPSFEKDPQLRKTVFKSVTGKMSDARSGFGRIKDAVGLRGHASKHSKDESAEPEERMGPIGTFFNPANKSSPIAALSLSPSPKVVGRAFTWKEKPEEYQNGFPKSKEPVSAQAHLDAESPPSDSAANSEYPTVIVDSEDLRKETEAESQWTMRAREIRRDLITGEPSVAGSVCGDGDLEGPFLEAERDPHNFAILLQRRHSFTIARSVESANNDAWWPRQMSFSDAEDAILTWEPIGTLGGKEDQSDLWAALQKQKYIAEDFRHLYEKIMDLQNEVRPWVETKVRGVEALNEQASENQQEFQDLYYRMSESYRAVKQSSQDILGDERSHVTEALKDIEVLGAKLEYEINALVSKVQDVEDGVAQFERQVDDLESRADELETTLKTESWAHWVVRSITGIGTGPNIVAVRPVT